MQEQASNHLKLLWSKAMVVSVEAKVTALGSWQVRTKEMSANEPLMRCRKYKDEVKTELLLLVQDKFRRNLFTA